MFGCSNPIVEPLISQAMLGTSFKGSVDLSFLPESLQQTAQSIQASSTDQEDYLFKLASMLISQDQTATALEHNSFSLEQMCLYQHAVATDFSALKKSAKAKSAQTTETSEGSFPCEAVSSSTATTQASQSLQEAPSSPSSQGTYSLVCEEKSLSEAETLSTPYSQNLPSTQSLQAKINTQVMPLDQATAKAIIAEVKKHKGPMPLPQEPHDERPVFPQEVENILKGFMVDGDDHQILLFQTLQQLSACNMRFSPRCFFKLAALFEATFVPLDYHFSSVMCQELLIKCGGPNFLYVLPFYLPKVKSIFFKPANSLQRNIPVYRVGDYIDGTVRSFVEGGDWLELFQKANKKDALGLLIKLRHDNPELALNLLSTCAMKFRTTTRVELIKAMKVNLSLADESFLLDMVKSDSAECSDEARDLLEELHGSQYAQNCAQIVREHLSYNAKLGQWTVKPIDSQDSNLTALGITMSKRPINTPTNEYLQYLLSGMDWEDLRDLTGATELKEVFVAWNNLKLFKSYELNVPELLASKIYAARDKKAARSFVQDYPRRFYWDDKAGRVLMLLDEPERIDALKLWRSCDPCPDWFVEHDYTGSLYKTHYVDEAWLEAVVQICLERTDEDETIDLQGRSRIFEAMSPSCMAWLLVMLEQFRAELEEVNDKLASVREKINSLSPQNKGYNNLINASLNLSVKRRKCMYTVYTIESLQRLLQLSIKIKLKTDSVFESFF